jgi:hypothetical protein
VRSGDERWRLLVRWVRRLGPVAVAVVVTLGSYRGFGDLRRDVYHLHGRDVAGWVLLL